MKRQDIRSIEDLKRFIKEFFKDKEVEVYLFGSRARMDHSRYSDIDIGFISGESIQKELTLLREIIEESNCPYNVDIVDLSQNDELLKTVLKEGKRWL